jgi:hydroxyacylglutathione hydrolase
MEIHRFINPHRLSNTYLLELDSEVVILVDVGNLDTRDLLKWLNKKGKKLTHVMLTHEHADHCCGLDDLYKTNPFQLLCTSKCAENIKNSKQNFSFYLEEIKEFRVQLPDISVVGDNEIRKFGGQSFTFIESPGHSPGGMCISTDNCLFTGDTVLNKKKTTLSFPHSNRIDYQVSMEKLKNTFREEINIYPGHGLNFICKNFEV